ncbi:carbonyl reductase [NADPH] 1-like [Cydia splendana]|uniref:carbonyl reductase [NADPH] 1-like n=1 Tax=Cydia splendana TaxID=1100963 RepID=UPI00300D596B
MVTKVAVVTGANKGIGFAIVRGLCKRFDGVVYLTSRDETRGENAVIQLSKEGLHPKYYQLDITSVKSVEKFRDYIKKEYGGIDILVNNAAIAFNNNTKEPVTVQAEQTLFVNYFSLLSTCEILFPILRNGARVVNISSSCGHLTQIPGVALRNRFKDPNLTIEQLGELMQEYIEAARKGTQVAEWGNSSYVVSKVGVTALTKIQQRMYNDRGK